MMVHFKVIQAVSEISVQAPEAAGWKDATKFDCRGRVVNGATIVAKKERVFSWAEYLSRVCRGFFWIGCTFGCALRDKSVRQLFTQSKTSLRFALIKIPSNEPVSIDTIKKSKKSHSHSLKSRKSKKPSKSKSSATPSAHGGLSHLPPPPPAKGKKVATTKLAPERKNSHRAKPSLPAPSIPKPSAKKWRKVDMFERELKDAKQELESGVVIKSSMCKKIADSFPGILTKTPRNGIIFDDNSPAGYIVFSLKNVPDLIFKMRLDTAIQVDSMQKRFEKMVYAKAVTMKFCMHQLVIPSARLFTLDVQGKTYELLAEQRLKFDAHISKQQQYYETTGARLLPALSQFSNFISQTGYRGKPVVDNPIMGASDQAAQIGFLNFNFDKKPEEGIRSLLRTVSIKNAPNVVNSSAAFFHVQQDPLTTIMEEREKAYQENRRLDRFHSQKKIRQGNELLQIDQTRLDFSVHPLNPNQKLSPKTVEQLQRFFLYVINDLNQQILKSDPKATRRWRRKLVIDLSLKPFDQASIVFVDPKLVADALSPEAKFSATYLGFVVKKLVDVGLLFKFEIPENNLLHLQA